MRYEVYDQNMDNHFRESGELEDESYAEEILIENYDEYEETEYDDDDLYVESI